MTLICSGKNVGENSVKTGLASAEALGVYRVCVCVCLCGCVPCVGRASFRLGNIGASFSRQGCINRQARHLFFSLHLLLFVLFSLSFFCLLSGLSLASPLAWPARPSPSRGTRASAAISETFGRCGRVFRRELMVGRAPRRNPIR